MKNSHSIKSERESALDILLEVFEEGKFSGNALDRELERQPRTQESRAFLTRLCEGTIERMTTIDHVIDACSSVRCRKMKPVIRNILRESVYQILFMDNVTDAVAVNEAVTLAKKRGFVGLSGFVNGVLRAVERKKGSFSFFENVEGSDPGFGTNDWVNNISIYYSVPEWLVRHMERCAGRKRAEAVFEEYLTVRPLQARVNLSKTGKKQVMDSLAAEGIPVSEHPFADNVILLKSAAGFTKTEAFRRGLIQIQDASSVLAVMAAGIRPGMRVLDVCAAPGGKSMYAADLLLGEAESWKAAGKTVGKSAEKAGLQGGCVISRDLTEQKVQRIRENASRCGFSGVIRAEAADARNFDLSLEKQADVVIADLPCSGLGVIAKKPDIKYRVQQEDLAVLSALQRDILSTVWRYVKPGGVLIYSTCTVNPVENEENVRWFLSQGYPMKAEDMTPFLPERLTAGWNNKPDRAREQGEEALCELQLFPGEYETDGFFFARFRRTS